MGKETLAGWLDESISEQGGGQRQTTPLCKGTFLFHLLVVHHSVFDAETFFGKLPAGNACMRARCETAHR